MRLFENVAEITRNGCFAAKTVGKWKLKEVEVECEGSLSKLGQRMVENG